MQIDTQPKFNFDNVLIRPRRSSINSRADVTLTRDFSFRSGLSWTGFPLIAANMDTTGTFAMAKALRKEDALVSLHKFYAVESLVEFFASEDSVNSFYTMGISADDHAKFLSVLDKVHLPKISIDVANGYIDRFVEVVKTVRKRCPKSVLMVGTVVTAEMTKELVLAGADIVRVGIGSGSACITRDVTGVGMPQLSAVAECSEAARSLGAFTCSDGGCKSSGDIAKAFGAGADFVMTGGMLAGHDECEGEWIYETKDGVQRRKGLLFYGMASNNAMVKHYGQVAPHRTAEGVAFEVEYRGKVSDTVGSIKAGISSCMTYIGARILSELPQNTVFVLKASS